MLRFFNIGFLFKHVFGLEIRLLAIQEDGRCNDLSVPFCNGPYSHTTSQSFDLQMLDVLKMVASSEKLLHLPINSFWTHSI
jgi:hypothetical protein